MKIDNFAVIVNTHSSCSDIWEMFASELQKYMPFFKIYIFTDRNDFVFKKYNYNVIIYDKNLDFRTQYLSCLEQIKEEFCLNLNDDYILFDHIDYDKIIELLSVLQNDKSLCQIRLVKAPNNLDKQYAENLYFLNKNEEYWYSQTISLWRVDTLINIHDKCPKSGIARKNNELQLEVVANSICKNMNLNGLYYFSGKEKKIGMYHYECLLIPHICSALVGGKWNIREYQKELLPLLQIYNIDKTIRGIY